MTFIIEYSETCDMGGEQLYLGVSKNDDIINIIVRKSLISYCDNIKQTTGTEYTVNKGKMEYYKLKSLIRKLQISLNDNNLAVADAISYSININNSFNQMQLQWWHEVPIEWTGIKEIQEYLISLITK